MTSLLFIFYQFSAEKSQSVHASTRLEEVVFCVFGPTLELENFGFQTFWLVRLHSDLLREVNNVASIWRNPVASLATISGS